MPRNTLLGELKMLETFIDYDGPRLFSCVSLTDQLYLALWVEEGEEGDSWIYLPISQARLGMVTSGGISLRAALESPEGFLYEVFMPHDVDSSDSVRPHAASAIPASWLPAEESFLNLETHTLPLAEPGNVFELRARQESRTRLRFELRPPDFARSEAPVRSIGALLTHAQVVYDNIGHSEFEENPPPRGRVPAEVARQTALSMVGATASSFVLEMASSQLDDLFGSSLFVDVTHKLLGLLNADLDNSELADRLAEIKPRAAKSFRVLVEKFAETGGDVTVAAAGTSFSYTARDFPVEKLHSFLGRLRQLVPDDDVQLIRGRMRLFQINTDRKTFGLRDETFDPHASYEGAIDDSAWRQASHSTVEDMYDVVIEGVTVTDEAIGERKTKYRLVQLTPVEGDNVTRVDP
ncbi:DUF6575 domain-containing protein [Streptomyces griseus]|uniref:DUF6575 domain-containing protein n=1 Tax=Streptomyces griseus TaxID=1911 RepID=UPI00381E7E0A